MSALEIPLTQGLVARVSEADFHLVTGRKWHATKHRNINYAARREGNKTIYMHRLIAGVVDSSGAIFVDHINFDGLDNRRENLRLVTPAQNAQHRRTAKTYLGLRGVEQKGSRWIARLNIGQESIYLGSFLCEREAGIAYDAAATVAFKQMIHGVRNADRQ